VNTPYKRRWRSLDGFARGMRRGAYGQARKKRKKGGKAHQATVNPKPDVDVE